MARRKQEGEPQKLCLKCGHVLPLSAFYQNKEWKAQSCRDAWCKSCVQKYCVSKEALKEFCWLNNREWTEQSYEQAKKKAAYLLASDADYIGDWTTENQKKVMEEKAACRAFLSMMNLEGIYRYASNQSEARGYPDYVADVGEKSVSNDLYDDELIYSREWNGLYSRREIQYLNDYYRHLENDFVLDNENLRDYARKVAKASLEADLAYDKKRNGKIGSSELKEAQLMFDNLRKSAEFAACKRRVNEAGGLGSFGELIAKLESSGILQAVTVQFPEDDVDRIIADYRHILTAVGIDQAAL